ncbi:MAG: Rne/Rng family ribonuclease [Sphingomicrobium sp.]
MDARHPEETRVAVAKGNRIEEFDFESSEHKQLKGNIYLAKVTRVEPSLQAAFIDYGGNRHGFLAFSEIHPDYYQIPKADRDALLREEAEHAAEEERLRTAEYDAEDRRAKKRGDDEPADDDNGADHGLDDDESIITGTGSSRSPVDESAADELRKRRESLRRRYKIQDVIQRRQVLLVQVVKEERANKGAALTTYLSLAGRYCVLMPNTSHGGGISRKISDGADRKRLKSIMSDLNLPSVMGLIVRTAGLSRTKVEIKRDFDYLARLWDEIRERTLSSSAPALIYRDSDLIKRAIRDLYHREIDEVLVEGDDGYKAARGFMKLLMPSHVRRVKQHVEVTPLFQRYGVEDQLSAMYHPVVQLPSGGYLVINPTEALVSIDINSGRSTREHNIEQTAYATNLEAAAEIARQLRLRDMAGLVVIDFIDMEQSSHNRKVEKAMKDALKNDRARIQVGRISSFGLMEMSRQRLRTGVLEASTRPCVHCEGTGLMRTASSAGLSALRMVEDEAARGRGDKIVIRAGREAAVYLLNKKRLELGEIEQRYGVSVEVLIDESLEGARMAIESSGPRPVAPQRSAALAAPVDEDYDDEDEDVEEIEAAMTGDEEFADEPESASKDRERERPRDDDGEGPRRRRRRRRGGRGRGRRDGQAPGSTEEGIEPDAEFEPPAAAEELAGEREAGEEAAKPRPRRRRGRNAATEVTGAEAPSEIEPDSSPMVERLVADEAPIAAVAGEQDDQSEAEGPKARRRPRARKSATAPASIAPARSPEADPEPDLEPEPAPTKPARKSRSKAAAAESARPPSRAASSAPDSGSATAVVPAPDNDSLSDDEGERRSGWWQRTFG